MRTDRCRVARGVEAVNHKDTKGRILHLRLGCAILLSGHFLFFMYAFMWRSRSG
uniref:Transmembrane protein n=1 Tax=Candidatus Kentrum sp. FM TaxID=2126340 RepID=A0A450WCM5_9GAMM|nr:MAG: hypothetical protein BECKFM1743C_GA0114222_103221 [Candidatus Kentron sp. FM]VFJ63621.1 MAG: hypothetical protein BECKFM1743A_GA0114220_103371 [Candidatus Kentron sp. FM]VFK14738.1 MAG: hypothetical protein BECKFM1743B_GA0114221_103371 [Candidatus Kentron sp. FM]